jgi:type IV pilus assembly protein PilA
MTHKAQLGFGLGLHGSIGDTLVTLGIIAVIAYIAVPAFRDYKALAHAVKAIESVTPAKAAIEKSFAAKGPADMSQSAVTGWTAPAATEQLQSVVIGRDGVITLRFTDNVAPQGQNEIQIVPVVAGKAVDLSLAANAGRKFEWQCGGPAGKTTLPEKHRPKNCR